VTLLSKDTRREAHPRSFALAAHPRKIADRPNPCRALRKGLYSNRCQFASPNCSFTAGYYCDTTYGELYRASTIVRGP